MRIRGFTPSEVVTIAVVVVVLAAIAVPLWRTHELRNRRDDAVGALLAVQAAQDRYFGKFARYASGADGLKIKPISRRGFYDITIRNSADNLGYWATARVRAGNATPDTRCVEMRIDQNGRRFAVDAEGVDRSADCWR